MLGVETMSRISRRKNGLPTVVTAGLGAGISGMALWTADLGGYLTPKSPPDPRLFMRWTEYSAFSPTMELLSTSESWPVGLRRRGRQQLP